MKRRLYFRTVLFFVQCWAFPFVLGFVVAALLVLWGLQDFADAIQKAITDAVHQCAK
ncbi:hypothetical protein [Pseudomonas sp. UBA6310]|uniref:hypothetical protein n=1 Tax=Pseudomonas sp. UBA6310 TaxID=1947327 RepID=UPI00257B321E|nr:hypothetical protein [Pseudomonas sp. UBA6310]